MEDSMCLAVPLRISRIIDRERALVLVGNSDMEVNISLIEDPQKGDYVLVHAGYAIERLERNEAETLKASFDLVRDGSGTDHDG